MMPANRPQFKFGFAPSTVVLVTACVGMFAVLVAQPVSAAIEIQFQRALNLSQTSDGQPRPVSVSIDALSGEICVTEETSSSLHVFNRAGIETFTTGRFAGLSQPRDGTVDHEGRLVTTSLVDGSVSTIVRLDVYGEPDGYRADAPAGDWHPVHLIVTRDGHYVTVDWWTGLLAKHDSATGALLWSRLLVGGGEGGEDFRDKNIGRPVQIADGTFFVPGGDLHRVFVVSETGELIESFGRFGSAPGRLVFPVAVAAGPEGSLLVLDRMRHKILIFDEKHVFVSEFGSMGDAPGRFYHPVSMATDGAGHLYVAQGYRGRVQVFSVLGDGAIE